MNAIEEIKVRLYGEDHTFTLSNSTDQAQFVQAMVKPSEGECFIGVYFDYIVSADTEGLAEWERLLLAEHDSQLPRGARIVIGETLPGGQKLADTVYFMFSTKEVESFHVHLVKE